MPWLTPDDTPAITGRGVCLHIPANYGPMVYGALLDLTRVWNWEQYGDDTPAEAAELMREMLADWEKICMPVGTIIMSGSDDTPVGYLKCNGRTHDEADYPELYAVLDETYISSPTQFKTPDLDCRVPIGVGSSGGLTTRDHGDKGGVETHQLTITEMPKHDHLYLPPVINLDVEGPGVPDAGATVIGPNVATQEAGGNGSHENMPPYLAVAFYIKAIP